MAKMKEFLDSDPARANREANHPEVEEVPEPREAEEQRETEDAPDSARLGPLGAFFKRRADFFEQEATMLAIQLERMWLDARAKD